MPILKQSDNQSLIEITIRISSSAYQGITSIIINAVKHFITIIIAIIIEIAVSKAINFKVIIAVILMIVIAIVFVDLQ